MRDDTIVWMDGELMRADEVRISPFDLGLTAGVGVFETMQAYDGKVFAFDRHHDRMAQSLYNLLEPTRYFSSKETLKKAIWDVLEKNDLLVGRARVRMSLTGGVNPLSGGPNPGKFIITAVALEAPAPMAILEDGAFPCNEFSNLVGAKTTSFADHISTWRYGFTGGADEVVRINTQGDLCECAMSNLFLVRDDLVMTPSLETGCLAGITREIVIEICEELGLMYEMCELEIVDLFTVDELFITSSIREVQPAEMLGFKKDRPYPVTQMISEAYRKRVLRGE